MSYDTQSRVLFVGPLWKGTSMGTSTCLSRFKALQRLGLNVMPLDTTKWMPSGPRPIRSMVVRIFMHPSVYRMNMLLHDFVQKGRYDVVWIEKGQWVYPWVLAHVRSKGSTLVHYNTDDIFGRHEYFWLHRLGIKYYNLCLTTNRYNVCEIKKLYGVKAIRVGMGFDSDFHRPANDNKEKKTDVIFVGAWRPQTEDFIHALCEAGIDVQIWGHNWWKARDPSFRKFIPLPHAEYVNAISQAKIALCFVSHWNRNESTGRSFELPAIGSFMLTEGTAEHEFIYGDGIGAGLFWTKVQLVEKARYFLENPSEREAIAREGFARSLDPGYSWTDHMRREWPIVERMLAQSGSMPVDDDDAPFWPGFRNGSPPPQARKQNKRTHG